MTTKIYESHYKDMKSIAMESSRLLIQIIPESGSKIQCIYDKQLKKEYLIQSCGETFKKSGYDSNFADGDVSGFDEVFPSIEQCYYPLEPWKGIQVPDHGEVWSMPWTYEVQGASVVLSVNGLDFRIDLRRESSF